MTINGIAINGYNDIEMDRYQVEEMIGHPTASEQLIKNCQEALTKAQNIVKEMDVPWGRLIFLLNPTSHKFRIWLD